MSASPGIFDETCYARWQDYILDGHRLPQPPKLIQTNEAVPVAFSISDDIAGIVSLRRGPFDSRSEDSIDIDCSILQAYGGLWRELGSGGRDWPFRQHVFPSSEANAGPIVLCEQRVYQGSTTWLQIAGVCYGAATRVIIAQGSETRMFSNKSWTGMFTLVVEEGDPWEATLVDDLDQVLFNLAG